MRKPSEAANPVRRILLIDDNRNGLAARKAVLEAEGYVVDACSSPSEGLALFASREDFQLVVTDYRMPGMLGTEVIKALREQRPAVPVLLVSGMVDVLGLNEQNTGADAVIAKNNTEVQNMVRAVSRLLRQRKPPGSRGTSARRKTG